MKDKISYKEARKKAGITSSAMMARLMGMTEQSYNLKENYKRDFKAKELLKFCEIVKISPLKINV